MTMTLICLIGLWMLVTWSFLDLSIISFLSDGNIFKIVIHYIHYLCNH